ncbi:hypothetical protein QMA10_04780 [Arthrobacter sp. APC 3897]|uniref:hypothetical protein n=1 Tax=Arthrobacter sp. APC 3897 TaxID=3035204 RepID=UPI0025B57DC0|nr:hypothetical protein [Arthrobacter sp. APC 3897]MDN3481237.1 hypothetical protein [Arthrobacter sp. APC 3897]
MIRDQLVKAGWDVALSKDLTVVLWNSVAGAITKSPNWRGNSGHWLCVMLADAVDAIDPGTVAENVGSLFEAALVDRGVTPWVAVIVGRGIAKATEQTLSTMDPAEQLRLGLLVVAICLCPRPEKCPEENRLTLPIFQSTVEFPSP